MSNPRAIVSLLAGLLGLGVLVAAGLTARYVEQVDKVEAFAAVPLAALFGLFATVSARQARETYQRTLGRSGGLVAAFAGRLAGGIVLLVSVTGVLALAVFLLLTLALDSELVSK